MARVADLTRAAIWADQEQEDENVLVRKRSDVEVEMEPSQKAHE